MTGLRWLAALLVFLFHVSVVGYFGGTAGTVVSAVLGRGGTGVSLFFVLSGFVLAWSAGDRVRARDFYRRRFARVWPAHAVWASIAIVVSAVVGAVRHAGQGLVSGVANLALVSAWLPGWWQAGNPVAWSLVCEAFFYATFPLSWRVLRAVVTPRCYLLVAVALYAAVWGLPLLLHGAGLVGSAGAAAHHPLARWPEFALGVLAAKAVRDGVWRGTGLRRGVAAWIGCYLLATVLAALRIADTGVMVIAHLVLVGALARCDRTGRRTGLGGARSVHLGAISYAFYLCHLLVVGILGALWSSGHPRLGLAPAGGLLLLALAVSLLLAEITHRTVERPARRWLLSVRRRGPVVPLPR